MLAKCIAQKQVHFGFPDGPNEKLSTHLHSSLSMPGPKEGLKIRRGGGGGGGASSTVVGIICSPRIGLRDLLESGGAMLVSPLPPAPTVLILHGQASGLDLKKRGSSYSFFVRCSFILNVILLI